MKNQVKKIHSNQAYQLYYHGMMLPGFIFLTLFNFVPTFMVRVPGMRLRKKLFQNNTKI